jgi:hypothetical protein
MCTKGVNSMWVRPRAISRAPALRLAFLRVTRPVISASRPRWEKAMKCGACGIVIVLAVCAGASSLNATDTIVIASPFGKGERAFLAKQSSWSTDLLLIRSEALPAQVGIRVLTIDGKERLSLKPLDDLHEDSYQKLSIWDATIRPDGGVSYVAVASRRIIPGRPRALTQVMAHYSSRGVLTHVWDMEPYHHHLIASDRENNIYAFGHRITGDTTAPYPLLLQYSPAGSVRSTLLTAADIGESAEPDAFVDGGPHELISLDDRLILLLRAKNELIEFRNGTRKRRTIADLASASMPNKNEVAAGMMIRDHEEPGLITYVFSDPPRATAGATAQTDSETESPLRKYLRVQPGLSRPEAVELVGGTDPGATAGRLFSDGGDVLRFVLVDLEGNVRISSRAKVHPR